MNIKPYADICSVSITGYTVPSNELESRGVDDISKLLIYMAKVSNNKTQDKGDTDGKLFKYLLKNKHFSPFEMVNISMEVTTTRDIARQILRHRSLNFQEFSGRYSDATDSLGFALREARLQDKSNRQNSIEVDDEGLDKLFKIHQIKNIEQAYSSYKCLLNSGIAKEQARCVLPEGNLVSKMYMNGTLRSWIHYIEVRTEDGVQKEHKMVAEKCKEELIKLVPQLYV